MMQVHGDDKLQTNNSWPYSVVFIDNACFSQLRIRMSFTSDEYN